MAIPSTNYSDNVNNDELPTEIWTSDQNFVPSDVGCGFELVSIVRLGSNFEVN